MKTLFSAVLVTMLCACASSTKVVETKSVDQTDSRYSGEPGDGIFPVIDAHTHNHFSGQLERTSKIPDTLEQYKKEMKEAGVAGAIVHMDRQLKDYQDLSAMNVMHCAGIDPTANTSKVEAGLAKGIYRCIKIYLGYVHEWAYSPRYRAVYRLAEKYKVPVIFHTGDTYSTTAKLKYADPLTIDEVAVDFPKVKFVIAHCGNPWIDSAAEVAYKNPNVYLEVSAFLIGDFSKYDEKTIETYVVSPIKKMWGYVEDPSKFMFGTDWPLTGMKGYMNAVKKAIPREHWKKVFHHNAVEVFGFSIKK